MGDLQQGVSELVRMSLVERRTAPDKTDFLEVPLAAALYGQKKLAVSPTKAIIEHDVKFLQDIGATSPGALKEGIAPRIETFFKRAARKIAEGSTSLEQLRPVLEFMSRGHPPAWLLLSSLEQEAGGENSVETAAAYVRRYLEHRPEGTEAPLAWRQLISLYLRSNNVIGGCTAFLKVAETSQPHLHEISEMAQWLNAERDVFSPMEVEDRKTLFGPMAGLLERHLATASATDLSRLAWLHLHAGHNDRALQVAEMGLRRDPRNIHCVRLVERLTN